MNTQFDKACSETTHAGVNTTHIVNAASTPPFRLLLLLFYPFYQRPCEQQEILQPRSPLAGKTNYTINGNKRVVLEYAKSCGFNLTGTPLKVSKKINLCPF